MHADDTLLGELEEFTCSLYGRQRIVSVEKQAEDKPLNAIRNVDIGTLPPCKICLKQHVKRVNYQVAVWKRAHIQDPDIESASPDHRCVVADGVVEPLWVEGDVWHIR